jgi:hypothetical protein
MKHFYCLGLCIAFTVAVHAQGKLLPGQNDSLLSQIPGKYLFSIEHKSAQVQHRINSSMERAVSTLYRQQEKLYRKVHKINPAQAESIFRGNLDSLGAIQKAMKLGKLQLPKGVKTFVPSLDTMTTSLKFLEENKALLTQGKTQLQDAIQSVASLQKSINDAAQIERYIKEQKEALKAQLSQFTGLTDDLKALNKEVYYYAQQFNEYKALISDKKKAEKKAMELLCKSKVYKDFLQRNSQLSGLFSLPSGNAEQQIEGLQTRSVVEEAIKAKIGSSPQARQAVSQLMDKATQEFAKYKNKLPDLNSAADMPDFKPNPMKGKTFLHRMEFGGNIQFQKTSQYFPSNTEIAGQAAYKLNPKSSAGIGTAYNFGMGTGWDHIRFSHQAISLRSFIDWKLKGSFYFNGGAEGKYIGAIRNNSDLKNWAGWKPLVLLGISKKYKINAKLNGNIQVLYDFMAKQQMPVSNPLLLRFGYTK